MIKEEIVRYVDNHKGKLEGYFCLLFNKRVKNEAIDRGVDN